MCYPSQEILFSLEKCGRAVYHFGNPAKSVEFSWRGPVNGPMSIREVARRAKVSIATVSRTLNNPSTVDSQTAERVRKAVADLGYFPNSQARSLVSGRSRILGLVVSDITNPFFPEIVQTFEDLAVKNNYEILLTSTVHDPKRMESSVRRMIERRVDGVAILTFGMEESLIEHLRDRKVPLVFVDVGPDVPGIANIRIKYLNGIRQAVQHLAAFRHTRIAFIAGPQRLKSARLWSHQAERRDRSNLSARIWTYRGRAHPLPRRHFVCRGSGTRSIRHRAS